MLYFKMNPNEQFVTVESDSTNDIDHIKDILPIFYLCGLRIVFRPEWSLMMDVSLLNGGSMTTARLLLVVYEAFERTFRIARGKESLSMIVKV